MSAIKPSAVKAFVKFITARERHRVARETGKPVVKPDPIISQYRFCNVRRNDDAVTKWVHRKILEPWKQEPNLWFALVVARLFNNPETLASILPWILPFKPEKMRDMLQRRAKIGEKNFNAAYIVSTAGAKMDKVDYVIDRILVPAWADRKRISSAVEFFTELERVHEIFMGLNGLASFMAAQVVADLKYADPAQWHDFATFCASGPGSKKGINVVLGRAMDAPIGEAEFRSTLAVLRDKTNSLLPAMTDITAQDLQNCLCEYSKYSKVVLGLGKPKQLYRPHDKES